MTREGCAGVSRRRSSRVNLVKGRITTSEQQMGSSMRVEQQISDEEPQGRVAPRPSGPAQPEREGMVRQQAASAQTKVQALATQPWMERIVDRENLNDAYRRVTSNAGTPGVDGMTVDDLADWCREHGAALVTSLLNGSYEPKPVRGVKIPKPDGGERQLGIPTVVDRLVQQAIAQVLGRAVDPSFSPSSFAFRPGRSQHDALRQAQEYVADGRKTVVDIDLETFFDRVNHDILMERLARHVSDKRLLRIVRRFLKAAMMSNGACIERDEGVPQGGPLSPLLSNLLLDDLDKELERRGHCFCRYADDCNIYVRSPAAGERVMASVTAFLEERLKLRVNRVKSAVAPVQERKFLGYRLLPGGRLGIAPKSVLRFKDRIRELTRRNRGVSFALAVEQVRSFVTGWVVYYRMAECRTLLGELDGWIRAKLRCLRLKQAKRAVGMAKFLRRLGVPERSVWATAACSRGWWVKAQTPGAQAGMSLEWFDSIGLPRLTHGHAALQRT